MKRWEYSGGWKFLAIVLNQACAVVLVLSLIVCTLYLGSGGFEIWDREETFENTAYYQNEVEEQIYRCIRAACRESKFEDEGVYNPEQAVNIEEYVANARILRQGEEEKGSDQVYYRLGDLIQWAEEGYETGTVMKLTYLDGKVSYIAQRSNERSVENPQAESLESGNKIQDVEKIEAVEERFAPIGYESLAAYAEIHQLSTRELQMVYQNLEETLSRIYNDFYAYEENLEFFSPGMTNMRYMVIPKSAKNISAENFQQLVSTNLKGFGAWKVTDTEAVLEYFRLMGDYLIFDSSDMSYEAENMPLSMGDVNNYLKAYPLSVEGDYILVIAVDPSYMANDNLQEYRQQYNELKPLSEGALYGLVLSAIVYVLTLIYLTMAAGRRTAAEDHAVHLNGFDRIKTEIALLLVLAPAAGVCVAAYESRHLIEDSLLTVGIWAGCIAFALNGLFLIGYLSGVRRLRRHTIWKNSILCAGFAGIVRMHQNRKVTTKIVVSYLAFLTVNFVLLMLGWWGLGFALLFDFVIGILLIMQALQRQQLLDGIEKIAGGDLTYQIPGEKLNGDRRVMAEAVNNIGKGLSKAVEKSVKDERLKSDLITNVSHDIKTPLTSIINYVDLLKREDIQNERAQNYIAILEDKAQRLKHLTEDLVEASKISSGNVKLEFVRIHFQELIHQTNGEFCEKFEKKGLQLVVDMPAEPVVIEADGRRLWRIIENLYNNVAKYAMPHTRVYVELSVADQKVFFSIKNISEQPLNIDASELTERFIRGDVARSTEGSGLGLSIAQNLTVLQRGTFQIYLDGDLFKVTLTFPEAVRTLTTE